MALFQASEVDLIAKAQLGDRSAFAELVQHHYESVIRVVYRLCGDVNMSEDATQEAFIRAWLNIPSFQVPGSLRAWLCRIAINATLDIIRREPKPATHEVDEQFLTDLQTDPEDILIEAQQAVLVKKAILSLPPASRVVLVLREYEEFSYQEIANVLDIPVGTVMSRLSYARNILRKELKEQLNRVEVENV